MTQRQRMNRAREYSRACRIRRVRRALWTLDAALLAGLAVLVLWCLRLEGRQTADPPPTVRPTAALLSAAAGLEEADHEPGETALFLVTGYCACCTPYSHMNQRDGLVLTASGEWTEAGACVAVDPEIIPLGSTVTVEGRTYRALDAGVRGYVIDILMDHEAAQEAGVKEALVTWKEAAE